MHTIKSNIAGDANKKNRLQKNICLIILNAYCMWWYCGSELRVNFRRMYVWIYGGTFGRSQNFIRASRNFTNICQHDFKNCLFVLAQNPLHESSKVSFNNHYFSKIYSIYSKCCRKSNTGHQLICRHVHQYLSSLSNVCRHLHVAQSRKTVKTVADALLHMLRQGCRLPEQC